MSDFNADKTQELVQKEAEKIFTALSKVKK